MAARISGVGLVTVSERRSIGFMTGDGIAAATRVSKVRAEWTPVVTAPYADRDDLPRSPDRDDPSGSTGAPISRCDRGRLGGAQPARSRPRDRPLADPTTAPARRPLPSR